MPCLVVSIQTKLLAAWKESKVFHRFQIFLVHGLLKDKVFIMMAKSLVEQTEVIQLLWTQVLHKLQFLQHRFLFYKSNGIKLFLVALIVHQIQRFVLRKNNVLSLNHCLSQLVFNYLALLMTSIQNNTCFKLTAIQENVSLSLMNANLEAKTKTSILLVTHFLNTFTVLLILIITKSAWASISILKGK